MIKRIYERDTLKIQSEYNDTFIKGARNIQGEWKSPFWTFPKENEEFVDKLLIEAYGDDGKGLIPTVTIDKKIEHLNAS